jgi:hypothetical protein
MRSISGSDGAAKRRQRDALPSPDGDHAQQHRDQPLTVEICVCGWYYPPAFYEQLRSAADRFDVVVIANRPGDTMGLRTIARENTGLDWGAFSYFVDHVWSGSADVLFLQDDTEVDERFWDDVEAIADDQAFIFRDEAAFRQAYSHGRAHFASARFLELVRAHGGIWFDAGNRGFIAAGPSWSETPPAGSLDHNAGIRAYTKLAQRIGGENPGLRVDRQVYSTHVKLGERGRVPAA